MKPHVISGHTFTVDGERYSFKDAKILGKGRFGVVTTATDILQYGRKIAIKRIRPFAFDEWDARHTLREVRSMQVLAAHPNIITLYDLSMNEAKSELYLVMEFMDCGLNGIIQSKQTLTEMHYKCLTIQILEGVKAMHEVGIVHRDLKPENLLVSKDCRLRIADFGNACFVNEAMTVAGETPGGGGYLWYRCPELLLASNRSDNAAIDLWSIGCILAELLRREPLFPGQSHQNQAVLIFELLGYVSNQQLGFEVSAETRSFLEEQCVSCGFYIDSVMSNVSAAAIDLISALLSIDPSIRPSAAQALSFDFLSDAETLCDYDKIYLSRPSNELFDFEQEKYSLDELKRLIISEVKISELRDQLLKAAHFSLLTPMARDGAQHFAWNNILEYLGVKDLVNVLTVVISLREGCEDRQPSFVATRAHLEEMLQRALRRTIITFRPDITMPTLSFGRTNSSTGIIVSDNSLTADRLRSVYMLVKNNVARECSPIPPPETAEAAASTAPSTAPSTALAVRATAAAIPASASAAATSIEINGDICVFRRHVSAADRGRWSVEVGFPACSCHANDCNKIVLWDCRVCSNPCSECDEHATICESCDRPACRGCFLNGEICKECGFQCNACHETIRHSDQDDHDRPFVCHGQSAIENSTPCPFGKGQGLTCWECEPGNARRCGQDGCYRMECGECNVIRVCGGCQEWCCIFCDERARRNHKDFFLLQSCVTCNFSLCYGCDMNGHHPHQEIFTCEECKVTYCTHCNVVSRCHSCWSPICSDCRPNKNYGYCETCDETFCSGCKVVSQCGACKTTQCEDCVAMAHCDLCAETFCDSCNDMTTCALCKSSVCNDCPLLPAENVTPDCHHPLECSHCFESYCGACRAVTECSVCFRLTCADCDEMTRCDECNKAFCGDCEEGKCKQCACCEGFECTSIVNFGHCDLCDNSYCNDCQPVQFCDKCDRHFCGDCHPASVTRCEICAATYCSDCKRDAVFCKSCNGCKECVNSRDVACCDKCLEPHCHDCRPVLVCSTCGKATCKDCLCPSDTVRCDKCLVSYCVDCQSTSVCSICAKVCCHDCPSSCVDPQCLSQQEHKHSMLQCTDCSEPFCSGCGYIHEIDTYLTVLMDTGGGFLATTDGPVTRSYAKTLLDANEQQEQGQEVGICTKCFDRQLGDDSDDDDASSSSDSSDCDDEEGEGGSDSTSTSTTGTASVSVGVIGDGNK